MKTAACSPTISVTSANRLTNTPTNKAWPTATLPRRTWKHRGVDVQQAKEVAPTLPARQTQLLEADHKNAGQRQVSRRRQAEASARRNARQRIGAERARFRHG